MIPVLSQTNPLYIIPSSSIVMRRPLPDLSSGSLPFGVFEQNFVYISRLLCVCFTCLNNFPCFEFNNALVCALGR